MCDVGATSEENEWKTKKKNKFAQSLGQNLSMCWDDFEYILIYTWT